MAFTPITGTVPQYSTADNELASGYYLKFYEAGTTTPLSVATDGTGGTLLAKVKLNARGLPITNPLDDDTVFIPHVDQAYRIVLYKSEADADANNTANAEFNIASVAPDVAPSADAADITLRTNSLEAWDDYDRSPLFVDGTDFTAGAGPHVITVPADWVPTDADFRIWKLDAPADTVIALTATTETSTTFTLAETLLSTDVIFIGDDQFRNIHDGDPADIKARLSLSDALLESNRFQEIEDSGSAAQVEAIKNLGLSNLVEVFSGSSDSVNLSSLAGGYPGDGIYYVLFTGPDSQESAAYLAVADGTNTRSSPGFRTYVNFSASGDPNDNAYFLEEVVSCNSLVISLSISGTQFNNSFSGNASTVIFGNSFKDITKIYRVI